MTERPESLGKAPRPRTTILEDMLDTDLRLLAQVARRLRLTQRAAKGRQVLDRELEKRLWTAFDQAAREQNLDPRLARQLFALLGSFGLEPESGRRAADKPFSLIPRSEAADIDITGPRCRARTRMLAALAAGTGQALRLPGAVLSDPLIELVKALNQAGAHLSWSDEGLEAAPEVKPEAKSAAEPGEDFPLRMEDSLIFVGEEPFTLHMLLAFALRETGRSKFAGGPGLKTLDLRPLNALLPSLGARLAPMNPRSQGLPARLESGGRMASRLELTAETPPSFAQALALAAWSYPEGLRLALPAGAAAAPLAQALDQALDVLTLCQVKARRKDDEYVIPAAQPRLPAGPELPLDAALSAYLLALPLLAGGKTRLSGRLALPAAVLADFKALGLAPDLGGEAAALANTPLNPGQRLGMGADPEYLPLALALALKAGSARLVLPAGTEGAEALAWTRDLLERLGAPHGVEGEEIVVSGGPAAAWQGVWSAPTPFAALGLALISFLRPGLALDNPGGLAALWPRFWALYNSLPVARDRAPAPREPERPEPKPRNRRVRVHE